MRKVIMKPSARSDVICYAILLTRQFSRPFSPLRVNFHRKGNALTMASNEVLILHVDASKKSDNECLCTGENRAATRRRKERKDKVSSPGPEVSIVSIEKAKPKRKKLNRSCPKSVTLLLSSEDEDEIEMMEVDSKAEKPTTKTSNSSNKSRTSTQTDSLLTSSSSPSTSSGSSSIGSQQAGTSKSTTDDGASTSSTKSNKRQLESDYLAALRLSRTLNSKSLKSSGIDGDKNDVVLADAALAKTLQEKEYGILNPKRDVTFVMESRVVMPGASPSSLLPSTSSSSNTPISPDTVHPPNEVVPTPLKQTTENRQKLNPLLRKHPTCWTECPNCPPDAIRKYHLISVTRGAPEWDVIAQPVIEAGFVVMLLRRIQNDTLWQRLCFEKQLMLRERSDVNEKFLYHTTRSQVSVICEEGLDQRLSRSVGNFGTGIYFRYL